MSQDSEIVLAVESHFNRQPAVGLAPPLANEHWLPALEGSGAVASRCAAEATGHFSASARLHDRKALLVVDRFATRPLAYRAEPPRAQFGPRVVDLADEDSEIDLQAVFDYLYFHAIPSPRTIFRGISRVPAGHLAKFDGQHWQVHRYWSPNFAEPRRGTFATLKEEFLVLLRDAVRAQLDGSLPACFLSGGTDSSTVAGIVREVAGMAPQTHAVGFDAAGYDEMAYARIAAKRFGTDHHEHYITPADVVALIPQIAAHHDQPFGNSSALPTYFCALRAKAAGVTRLLAGDGGDELFGGNTRYAKQRVFAAYDIVPRALRTALLEPAARSGFVDSLPLIRKAASYVRQAMVPMPDRLQTYNLLHRLGLDQVLAPAVLRAVDTQGPERQQREIWAESEGADFVNRMLAFDWRYTLAENDLPKVGYGTAQAGVSVGYPLLDAALVQFSAHLPTRYKLKGLTLRWFFKEALRGFLPDEIISKKKHGFGLPFGLWAAQDPALNALARDSVRGLAARGVIRTAFADDLIDRLLPAHPSYYGEMVWVTMMLEQWFQHHRPNWRPSAH